MTLRSCLGPGMSSSCRTVTTPIALFRSYTVCWYRHSHVAATRLADLGMEFMLGELSYAIRLSRVHG